VRTLLIAAICGSCGSRVFSQDKSPQTLKGWGDVVDPDGDCRVRLENKTLTVAIPAVKHDLSVEVGDINAPRVLSPIEGDFIVRVKVGGNIGHAGKPTSKMFAPYHGGGFLLWQDARNYVRLERAAITDQRGEAVHYANFEFRKDGKRVGMRPSAMTIRDAETYLQLERRGNRILGSVSGDGVQWHPFKPLAVSLNQALKVGIVAINTSTERFRAEFSELEVYRKEVK
jgi:hypothetical protein